MDATPVVRVHRFAERLQRGRFCKLEQATLSGIENLLCRAGQGNAINAVNSLLPVAVVTVRLAFADSADSNCRVHTNTSMQPNASMAFSTSFLQKSNPVRLAKNEWYYINSERGETCLQSSSTETSTSKPMAFAPAIRHRRGSENKTS